MKKMLAVFLFVAVLCLGGAALADQWGMSGVMSDFLEKSGDYDDVRYPELNSGYSADAEFVNFIIRKGDENLLVMLRRNDKGKLEEIGRYPGALQPVQGSQAEEFWNSSTEDGIRLKSMWSKVGEEYTFAWNGHEMILSYANTGSLTITLREDGEGYTVNDGWEDSRWLNRPQALAEFRMDMLPQSSAEVFLWDAQTTYHGELLDYSQRVRVDAGKKTNLPVYAAPSEMAYRGAEGKAAVSLSEPFDVLAAYPDGWYMVEYEITRAERRIGFVQGLDIAGVQELHLIGTLETLAADTPLTDDPHATRRSLTVLPAGTEVEVLGCLDAFWLCVSAQVDGKDAWGFIPVNSVVMTEKYQVKGIMEQLQGTWRSIGGGQMLGDGVIFDADGTMTICTTDDYTNFPPVKLIPHEKVAAWCVCAPWDQGLWLVVWPQEDAPSVYELAIAQDNGSFRVTWAEAGSAYERYDIQ